jgi:hypothetical protein
VLDLFLYDVWESLWGKDLADQQVKFESGLRGLYDYETAGGGHSFSVKRNGLRALRTS